MMLVEQMLKNAPKPLLHIADVSGCFSLAKYINGYYEYSDNTDDGDIYMNVVTRKFMTETEIVKEWVRLNNR